MNKTHVQAGDIVKVISGNHRGAQGKILRVIREKNQVLIEGVRMIKKHMRRSQERPQGEIIEREGPIHISNVKLLEKLQKQVVGSEKKSAKKAKPSSEKIATSEEPKKKAKSTKASSSKVKKPSEE